MMENLTHVMYPTEPQWTSPQDSRYELGYEMNVTYNDTSQHQLPLPMYYSLPYIIVGFIATTVIFIVGLTGNIMVVIVVLRTKNMHSPTNCYLVSLAIADILLLVSAPLPTIVEYFLIIDQSVFGRAGCSIMVFAQYLGLNVSSLSITAFTIERYIAICHPMKAQSLCTVARAKRIILALWIFGILYCTPWLALATTRTIHFRYDLDIQACTYKLKRHQYVAFYMADLVIFYVLPLTLTLVLYSLIAHILFRSNSLTSSIGCHEGSPRMHSSGAKLPSHRSRIQVVKMLAVVVMMFAILWLPYRFSVVYNSFAQTPYHDLWFRQFCRLMVYSNSAINPILYNAMSVKFRRAFRKLLWCSKADKKQSHHTRINYQHVKQRTQNQHNMNQSTL